MRAPDGTGLRRAAWDIADLSDVDRVWILSQLSEQERHQLGQLVEEAASSERDKENISAFNGSPDKKSVERLPFGNDVLTQLPDWLATRALLCAASGVRGRLLSEVPWARRRRLSRALKTEEGRSGVTAATSAVLLRCLQALPFEPAGKR